MKGRLVQGIAGITALIAGVASADGISADQPARDYYIALGGDSVAAG